MPRFSIVAPNLNEMPYLKYFFLSSLKHQTFKDFEVIIVDGGSNDGSLEAIQQFHKFFPIKVMQNKTRNIGYISNLGCNIAKGEFLVNTSSDIYFPSSFFKELDLFLDERPKVIAINGIVIPHGSHFSLITHFAHGLFNVLRFLFTCKFMPIKKLRPSGNFLAIKSSDFFQIGGYPNIAINEDGLFGYKLDEYWTKHGHKTCYFSLKYKVYHHVKRFDKKGGLRGMFFYIYVLYLIFPFLKPFLKPIELIRAKTFRERSDLAALIH